MKFWERVDKGGANGCWIWKGGRNRDGYGYVNRYVGGKRKVLRAHRLSWIYHHKKDPGKFLICHRCDNPPCVNWDHLFKGTSGDNMRDMIAKGRKVVGGRKLTNFEEGKVRKLLGYGIRGKEVASCLGLTYGIVYRIEKLVQVGKKARTNRLIRCCVVDGKPLRSCTQSAVTKVNYKFSSWYFCSRHGLSEILNGDKRVVSIEAVK